LSSPGEESWFFDTGSCLATGGLGQRLVRIQSPSKEAWKHLRGAAKLPSSMGLNIQTPTRFLDVTCVNNGYRNNARHVIPVRAATTIGPGTRRNMMAGGRKKFYVTGRMQFTDPAVAVDTERTRGIPNFGTSIFAQTLANTPPLTSRVQFNSG
jgi:hypothetical protein